MGTVTTPRLGLIAPDGNDPVRNGDDLMRAAYAQLDDLTKVGIPFRMSAGSALVVASGSVPSPSVAVTFPAGRFSQIPIVVGNLAIATASLVTNVGSVTPSGFTATVFHNTSGTNVPAASYGFHWIAVQMLTGASPG